MEWNNTNISIVAGLFLVASIMAFLLIPLSQQSTIILTTPSGPASCLVPNDFVLAQQLDDLCDVVIISPSTSELIVYNGTHWVNANVASIQGNATCVNLGSGTIICPSYGNNNINLKSLLSGSGISISNDSTTITITNTGVLSNVAGTGISVNQTTGNVLITNTAPDNTTCVNVGGGTEIYKDGECNFKTLLSGTGITISNSTNTITLTNTLPEVTACSNTGSSLDATICNGGNVALKGFKESTGIDIVNNTNDITIKTKFANGTGISITGSTIQTFTNTGVTSLASDDTATLSFSGSTGSITASPTIKKLCEATAVGGETSLTCTLSSSQEILLVMIDVSQSADTNTVFRMNFNNDTGNNYATRSSTNGGADATTGSISGVVLLPSGTATGQFVHNNYRCIDNNGQEKHCYGERTTAVNGAANVPSRVETASKWANTANNITSVNINRTAGTGVMQAGNNIIVWGLS